MTSYYDIDLTDFRRPSCVSRASVRSALDRLAYRLASAIRRLFR